MDHGPDIVLAGFSWWCLLAMVAGLLQGGGFCKAGAEHNSKGLTALGVLVNLLTIVIGIAWMTVGPFAMAWIFVPFLVLGGLFLCGGGKVRGGAIGLLILVCIAYGVSARMGSRAGGPIGPYTTRTDPPPPKPLTPVERGDTPFIAWPEKCVPSEPGGYLMSERTLIPVRAVARYPLVALFGAAEDAESGNWDHVVDQMKTWTPYYVFRIRGNALALLIGEAAKTKPEARRWVREQDVFCWMTRECLNIEKPVPIYATREAAEKGANPLDPAFEYRYAAHFESGAGGTLGSRFHSAALPVLVRQDGEYWCFVRPGGAEVTGYQTCWVKWDGNSPEVCCRIRASRREIEEYVNGLRELMITYKNNPAKRTEAKVGMYDSGQAFLTLSDKVTQPDRVTARLSGVPKLGGFLARPLTNELEYERMSKQAVALPQLSLAGVPKRFLPPRPLTDELEYERISAVALLRLSMADIYDVNDVSYIDVNDFP